MTNGETITNTLHSFKLVNNLFGPSTRQVLPISWKYPLPLPNLSSLKNIEHKLLRILAQLFTTSVICEKLKDN